MFKKFIALIGVAAMLAVSNPALAGYTNITEFGPPQAYTPALAGQTDQPGVTYTTQFGRYYVLGGLVFFKFKIVTSGTTTKTTTTDNFAVTLPIPAATNTGDINAVTCDAENATPITYGSVGIAASGATQILLYAATGTQPALNLVNMTWATTAPGIGVLSHVITVQCSGVYETSF